MRSPIDPNSEIDQNDLKRLNAEPWQIALLDLNPDYPHWGPHEDYMHVQSEHGWNRPLFFDTWAEFAPQFSQDDYNEIAHFYFEVNRASKNCECRHGYHPDAAWVSESFYRHSSPFVNQTQSELETNAMLEAFSSHKRAKELLGQPLRRSNYPSEEVLAKYKPEFRLFCEAMARGDGFWHDKITDDEVQALVKDGRINNRWNAEKKEWEIVGEIPSAAQVNAQQHSFDLKSHDAINRSILVKARCKRFGIPMNCIECEGHGYVYTAPVAHVGLVLWVLHPRKGASRGIEIKNITQTDLPEVYRYLKEAHDRSVNRFAKVAALAIPIPKINSLRK